jgi:NTE family protein
MRALVLSGGGAKGAYQVGVLKRWMGDKGIDYDINCGVSVGALNTAGLAITAKGDPGKAIHILEKFWLEKVNTKAIYKRWFPFGRFHSLWKKSVYDSSPLANLVNENIHLNNVLNNGRLLAVGAVCLDTGENVFARESNPEFIKWVLASASFPVFLAPIEIDGKLWSDGGIKNVTPIGQAIRMGASEIDVIMCTNMNSKQVWNSTSKNALPDQALRVVDLMSDQIINDDIKIVGLKNDLADINPKYRKISIRLVQPSGILLQDSLQFTLEDTKRLIELGYNDADNAITL